MKTTIAILLLAFLASCSQNPRPAQDSPYVDSLALEVKEIRESYRPGLGEIMLGIQLHHAKLWFAGTNNNWKLAEYEIGEIKESLEEATVVETNRPEVKTIGMITPAVDSVAAAIQEKNLPEFKRNFELMTATCNNCHTANKFEFNVITIPTALPVTNQDFKPKAMAK